MTKMTSKLLLLLCWLSCCQTYESDICSKMFKKCFGTELCQCAIEEHGIEHLKHWYNTTCRDMPFKTEAYECFAKIKWMSTKKSLLPLRSLQGSFKGHTMASFEIDLTKFQLNCSNCENGWISLRDEFLNNARLFCQNCSEMNINMAMGLPADVKLPVLQCHNEKFGHCQRSENQLMAQPLTEGEKLSCWMNKKDACLNVSFVKISSYHESQLEEAIKEQHKNNCWTEFTVALDKTVKYNWYDSGYLVCWSTNGFRPQAKILPIYFAGPPKIIKRVENQRTLAYRRKGKYLSLNIISHPPAEISVWHAGQQINRNLTVWPADQTDQPILYYVSNMWQEQYPNWTMVLYELWIEEENSRCRTGGEYVVKICNGLPPCALPSVKISKSPACDIMAKNSGKHGDKGGNIRVTFLWTAFVLAVAVMVIVVLALALGQVSFQRRHYSNAMYGIVGCRSQRTEEANVMSAENPLYFDIVAEMRRQCKIAIIPLEELDVQSEIGEGAFGTVYLVTRHTATSIEKLAMKQLKFANAERMACFQNEALLLTELSHPNIVKFIGLVIRGGSFALLFEYMEMGDLANFLRCHNNQLSANADELSLKDQMSIACRVANGLAYLAGKHFVHRDVAARNCLVGLDLVVKLSDFGMSRDVYLSEYYKMDSHTLVPLRWLPPESIAYRRFTTESDVWSFGVLLWEIFSLGQLPWYSYSNCEVFNIISNGDTLGQPTKCPDAVYKDVMLECWKIDAENRPTPAEIRDKLREMLQKLNVVDHYVQAPDYCSTNSVSLV